MDCQSSSQSTGLRHRGGINFHFGESLGQQIHKDGILAESSIDKNFFDRTVVNNQFGRKHLLRNDVHNQLVVGNFVVFEFIETPVLERTFFYIRIRIKRGLFEFLLGKKYNSDVNGSLNIGRKYLTTVNKYTIEMHNKLLSMMGNPRVRTV